MPGTTALFRFSTSQLVMCTKGKHGESPGASTVSLYKGGYPMHNLVLKGSYGWGQSNQGVSSELAPDIHKSVLTTACTSDQLATCNELSQTLTSKTPKRPLNDFCKLFPVFKCLTSVRMFSIFSGEYFRLPGALDSSGGRQTWHE